MMNTQNGHGESGSLPAFLSVTLARTERPARILVVDPDEAARQFICQVLRQCGYDIAEAANGMEALLTFRYVERGVDLVISEVVMPHVSGWDLISRLRRTSPDVKLLLISGYTAIENSGENPVIRREDVREAVDIMRKPISIHELSYRVRDLLAG